MLKVVQQYYIIIPNSTFYYSYMMITFVTYLPSSKIYLHLIIYLPRPVIVFLIIEFLYCMKGIAQTTV